MNLFYLSFRQLSNKPLATFLCVLLLSLGVSMMSLLLIFRQDLEQKFEKNIEPVDLVIGSKGSPLQLILSAVYQIDSPTGTISWETAQEIRKNKWLKNVVFLAYGDNYQSFPIVGTSTDYAKMYAAKLQTGRFWEKKFEITLGYKVAKKLNLKLHQEFFGTHGQNGQNHEEHPYKVVGILDKTNTVLDQLILTSMESIWESHEQNDHKEITAILARFANPMARLMLASQINSQTNLQLALPALEVNRLFELLGVGVEALQILAFFLALVAGLAIFITLYNLLKERRFELALMRSLGASRLKIYFFVIFEGLFLGILGFIFGLFLSRLGIFSLNFLVADYHYDWQYAWINDEFWIGIFCIILGVLAAFFPAWQASRTDIAKILR